ncbi:Isochorismatase [Actinomycetales bacterium JB111]|nr:Isochorismatase [Actinomycetales bacterium JB111]
MTDLGGSLAVVVVDVQNDFCSPDGTMAGRGLDLEQIPAASANLVRLAEAARAAGVPVVHVRTHHDEDVDSAAWDARYNVPDGAPVPPRNCRPGTWGAEPWAVTDLPGEQVHIKHRYSGFTSPTLEAGLRELGATTLLVCGVATEVCVETTLRDALERDFHVAVVGDASATYARDIHDQAVARMGRHWGLALTTDQAVEAVGRASSSARAGDAAG